MVVNSRNISNCGGFRLQKIGPFSLLTTKKIIIIKKQCQAKQKLTRQVVEAP